jgi:hypothetical protein
MVIVRFVAVIPNEGSGDVVVHPVTRRSALPQDAALKMLG